MSNMEVAMRISEHARRRLWERFPEIQISIEDLFRNKNPYGVWTPQTEVFINLEYKIVFIVACNEQKQKTLVTVMSEDHYRSNCEVNGFMSRRLNAVVEVVQQTCSNIIQEKEQAETRIRRQQRFIQIKNFSKEFAQHNVFSYPEIFKKKSELRKLYSLSRTEFNEFIEQYFAHLRESSVNF